MTKRAWHTGDARVFPDCHRCHLPFDLVDGEPQYIYCPPCRKEIRAEAKAERIKDEVARMEWPPVIGI